MTRIVSELERMLHRTSHLKVNIWHKSKGFGWAVIETLTVLSNVRPYETSTRTFYLSFFFYIFFAPSTCFVCLFPTLDCGVTTTAPKTSGSPLLKQQDNASYTQNVKRNRVYTTSPLNDDRVRGREKGCSRKYQQILKGLIFKYISVIRPLKIPFRFQGP